MSNNSRNWDQRRGWNTAEIFGAFEIENLHISSNASKN